MKFKKLENIIEWNGEINITESKTYYFSLKNVSGGAKVFIDENLIYDDTLKTNNIKEFSFNLNKGNHKINLAYSTNKDSRPNLFWKNKNNNYEKISNNNLFFKNGIIKKKTLPIKAQIPESYEIDYNTYPTGEVATLSIDDTRIPVLLIHGIHGSNNVNLSDARTWNYLGNIPTELYNKDNDVWEFVYAPANVSNFMTAGLLKNEINDVLDFYNTNKLDIVAHSMGGLVTLGYIEGLGFDINKNGNV